MKDEDKIWTTSLHACTLPDADRINARILAGFAPLSAGDFARRTHFFGGRFENLYLDLDRMPEQRPILDRAEACAREILAWGTRPLRRGAWFNAQGPGQSTSEHTHEEQDELLSGVYYIKAPRYSGDIVLFDGLLEVRVTPKAGMFLFFAPGLRHRVEPNHSRELRLSLAFNFGPGEAHG